MSNLYNNWSDFLSHQKKIHEDSLDNKIIELSNKELYSIESNLDKFFFDIKFKKAKINVVLPYKNRFKSLLSTINSFKQNKTNEDFCLTVVEYSEEKTFNGGNDFNYIWIPSKSDEFNKSLCLNVGVLFVDSELVLLHDVDLFVDSNFLDSVLDNYYSDSDRVIQCFTENMLYNLNEIQTEKLHNTNNNDFLKSEKLTSVYPDMPPFGSILLSNDLFFKIGGFDDNLFENWGCEDTVFKLKFETLFNKKYDSCKNPEVCLYHMYHKILDRNEKNNEHYEFIRDLDTLGQNRFINNQINRFNNLKSLIPV
jgi:hypothetical protein